MFFTQSLSTFSPKNRAWKKLVDWIRQYEHILIKDECSLDAMKAEIESKIEEINAEHPKLKQIVFSGDNNRISGCFSAKVMSCGCPDIVFTLNYCTVKRSYEFSENNNIQKGGQLCLQVKE